MAGHYLEMLHLMLRSAGTPLSELCFLQPRERAELHALNTAALRAAPERLKGVHQLFEEAAAASPHAVAVAFSGAPGLTYAALDGRANQLAHFLRQRGVQAGGQ